MSMSKYRSVLAEDFGKLDHGESVWYVYSDEWEHENDRDYFNIDGEWVEIDGDMLEFGLDIRDANGIELMENDVVSFDRLGESYLGIIFEVGGYAGAGEFGTFSVPSSLIIALFDGSSMVVSDNEYGYASFPFDELITNIQREYAYRHDYGYRIKY